MRDYELIFILSPKIDEENIPGTVEKVSKLVTDRGGTIESVDHWGKRKLAYPIRRFSEGNYVSTHLKLKPTELTELETNLKLAEDVIRYLLVRSDD